MLVLVKTWLLPLNNDVVWQVLLDVLYALRHRVVIDSVAYLHWLVVHIKGIACHLHACVESGDIVPEVSLQEVSTVNCRVSESSVRLHICDALVMMWHAFNSCSLRLFHLVCIVLSHLQLSTLEVGVGLQEVNAFALFVAAAAELLGTLLVEVGYANGLVLPFVV